MFIRTQLLALASVLAIPMLAVASPAPSASTDPSACNTGTAHCCESVHNPGEPNFNLIGGLVGALIDLPANVPVGLNCAAITLGVGGNHCTQQVVCCTGNHFEGLIAIGCSPISLL